MFAVSVAFLPTRTFFVIVWAAGVNVSVPSKTLFSPSSKSRTSSSKIDEEGLTCVPPLILYPRWM